MTWPMTPHVGMALAPHRLAAVLPDGRTLETDDVSDLGQVFRDLRARAGLSRARVALALVPPLVELRTLTLPPMKDFERQRIIERDARRYFVNVSEPLVIGTARSSTGVVAAAVPAELLTRIESAIALAGWSLATVIPAPFAWTAGVPDGQIAISLEQGVEVLRVAGHRLLERRRYRTVPAGCPTLPDPLVTAARHAWASGAPELVSTARRAVRRRVTKRVITASLAAAAALLFVAGGLDYWGLAHRLRTIETRRAALAPAVASAIAASDSLGTMTGGLTTLRTLTASNRRWSTFLTDLADFLPRDAHLVALRVAGDSATLEGVAERSAGVFDALEQMPSISGLRAAAPIQRDIQADGSVREHFAFDASLAASGRRP
ncbi:MAG TPA: hypothetical protein VEV39_08590 [Gemmatimonadales bacterium]|nr:hypothetical protein [Gemmatimonadales bacterium]